MKQALCLNCGEQFPITVWNKKFCSRNCNRNYNLRLWTQRNRAKKRAWVKDWVGRHKERYRELCRASGARYRAKNPEGIKQIRKRYEEKHPEKLKAKWANRSARLRKAPGNLTKDEWETIKREQDYTCALCEKKEPEITLTRDHIIPLMDRGSNYPLNIQALCSKCNSRKGALEQSRSSRGTFKKK